MRFRQVLAVGSLALAEGRDSVEPYAIDAPDEPKVERLEDRILDLWVVEVQVGLMRVETVPVVRVRHVVPRPVGGLEVLEDDARVLVALVGLAPHVEVTGRAARLGVASALEPGVLVGGGVADTLVDQ